MKVLLATDGSKNAEQAAWLLAHLPHRETLELDIVTVAYKPEMHGTSQVLDWMHEYLELESKQMRQAYERVAAMFEGANVSLKHVAKNGHPGSSIVETAKELEVDLVVMGATGSPTIERLLLGSTSEFVATHAQCSVLVVRPTGVATRAKGDLRITLAYDGSEPCKKGIEVLDAFSWQAHTKLDLMTVVSPPISFSEIPIPIDTDELKTAALGILQAEAEAIRSISTNIDIHVVEANNAGEGIVQFAQKEDADIVMVGDTGRGLLGRFLMGSVSRYVLRHTTSSVWISRAAKTH